MNKKCTNLKTLLFLTSTKHKINSKDIFFISKCVLVCDFHNLLSSAKKQKELFEWIVVNSRRLHTSNCSECYLGPPEKTAVNPKHFSISMNSLHLCLYNMNFNVNLSLTFGRLGGTGSRSAPLSSGLSVFVFSSSEDGRMCILSLCLCGALMATKS